ncbi:type II secretion system F family protein [Brevibacterium litoralis]|uniref:type II secretion system F family protein n=1 Tax=Brevibacterium litoralis TaxID=3138935 RepID=UPI0032EC70F2
MNTEILGADAVGPVLVAGILVGLSVYLATWSGSAGRLRGLLGPGRATVRRSGVQGASAARGPGRTWSEEAVQAAAVGVVDRAVELLRVGMPPATVMRRLAELTGEPRIAEVLRRTARSLDLGEPPHRAVRRHLDRLPAAAAGVFDGMAAVWSVAETAGAPAADMLQRYARTCRTRADADRERAAQIAGPRSTVTVLTWLPFISLGLAMLIGANPFAVFGTVPGALALVSGLALLVSGRLWMGRLLRSAR